MARILVRNPDNKKRIYRLWCNTIDQWVSTSLTADGMVQFLMDSDVEKHIWAEAHKRVHRIPHDDEYDTEHLKWLYEFFDSRISNLNYRDRRNKKAWDRHNTRRIERNLGRGQ